MILKLKSGCQLVMSECHWVPGSYISAGNLRGSQGAILRPAELDKTIEELTRIRDQLREREAEKQAKRNAA